MPKTALEKYRSRLFLWDNFCVFRTWVIKSMLLEPGFLSHSSPFYFFLFPSHLCKWTPLVGGQGGVEIGTRVLCNLKNKYVHDKQSDKGAGSSHSYL